MASGKDIEIGPREACGHSFCHTWKCPRTPSRFGARGLRQVQDAHDCWRGCSDRFCWIRLTTAQPCGQETCNSMALNSRIYFYRQSQTESLTW